MRRSKQQTSISSADLTLTIYDSCQVSAPLTDLLANLIAPGLWSEFDAYGRIEPIVAVQDAVYLDALLILPNMNKDSQAVAVPEAVQDSKGLLSLCIIWALVTSNRANS